MLRRLTGDLWPQIRGCGMYDAVETPTGEQCLQQEQLPLVRLMCRLCSVYAPCGRSLMKTLWASSTRAGVSRSCSELELPWP